MKNGKHVLLTFAVIIPVDDEPFEDFGEKDRISKRIEDAIQQSLGSIPDNCGTISTRFTLLDSNEVNCGQCAKCGIWTTDKEIPNSLRELSIGATVDNALLCDLCLPKEHKWAF